MRFMYQYPEVTGSAVDMLDCGPVADLARAAEAAGWSGFSFTEHPAGGARWLEAGGHQTLDPFVALGHVAAVTSRLRLFTYLTVVPYRNPLLLAKAATTVDRLSDGRFTLGVGTGYLKTEFFALGVEFDERNALFDEALDVLPLCWRGKPFTYHGHHFDARDIVTLPRPVQDPIPIWIGGNSRVTRQRATSTSPRQRAPRGSDRPTTSPRRFAICVNAPATAARSSTSV
jgi:probable F420-dependent oxidoreductase